MINVSHILQQRINEIQSRIPVKLSVNIKSDKESAVGTSYNSDEFKSLLQREVSALSSSSASAATPSKNTNTTGDKGYIESVIDDICLKYDVSPTLVKSIIKAESGFNPNAVSSAGAMGLMQLMPATAKSWGVENPFDIYENITGGVKLIKNNLNSYDGDVSLALAAYNAGPGAVQKYGGVPPYNETQNYIKKVLQYMQEYGATP